MRVIVTTGATREPLDDVRYLTNVSTGRFGYEAARAFHARGCDVRLLGPPDLEERRWYALPFRAVPYTTVVDLQSKLHTAIAERRPDALLMAAAVSDYAPRAAVSGKLSSADEELRLSLARTPKLLASLRERCGPETFLVGFKLLSGVPEEELRRVAQEQNAKYRLDLTVANDLALLTPSRHPMFLATPAGEWLRLDGTKAEVAERIAAWVLEAVARARARPPAR
ncbi:MAG: phosphopantothenoylcysteine decarboxylase [Planctomycetes bacterium]|nr:phosphopantothenoylcysteine decarboxylase [Planctomycetota bacterium]